MDLKYAIVVGIGAFIAFIGMKSCGIVAADPSTFVTLGNLGQPQTLLAVAGVFLIGALMALRIPGAMIDPDRRSASPGNADRPPSSARDSRPG